MTLFVFGISLLGMMAGVVLLILGLIKKKKLKGGIVLGVSVLLFFVSLIMPAPEGSKEKIEVASKTQEELNVEKEAEQAKKEEEKKTLEDEKKAKEEEKTAKIEEERKAKEAKQQAEEEAKLKEEQAAKAKTEKEAKAKAEVKQKEETKLYKEPSKPVYIFEGEANAEIYPASSAAMLYDKTQLKFKGMNYYFKGELVGIKKLESLFGNMEDALLVKNDKGYVMPIFSPHEIDATVGQTLEAWGPLSGDGYAASDLGINNVVGMTGAMNATQISVNGEMK